MLTRSISTIRTNAKSGSNRKIRQFEFLTNNFHQLPKSFDIVDSFSNKSMQDGSSSIFRLQVVLMFQNLKDIIRVTHGKMRRIGVKRLARAVCGPWPPERNLTKVFKADTTACRVMQRRSSYLAAT